MTMFPETEPRLAGAGTATRSRRGRAVGTGARRSGAVAVVFTSLLAGFGWVYALRGLAWFDGGASVHDALPLLQLAGYDVQPLDRVVVAWLLAGVVAGTALRRVPRARRALLVGAPAVVSLVFASQVAYALTRNLRLSDVVWSRSPGLGPWLEALVFAAGCALPGSLRMLTGGDWVRRTQFLIERIRDLGVRPREHGDAGEHDRERHDVGDSRPRTSTE
jgi:hypothetical protein